LLDSGNSLLADAEFGGEGFVFYAPECSKAAYLSADMMIALTITCVGQAKERRHGQHFYQGCLT
jgi:hypothetical protein